MDYLSPKNLEILQLNLGYMCNQVCSHCHVDAGPDRKEMMSREILEKSIEILQKTSIYQQVVLQILMIIALIKEVLKIWTLILSII